MTRKVGIGFWASAVAGWAVIGIGLRGVFAHALDTRPSNLAQFAVGGALIHDLLVAPLVIAAGVLVARTVRPRARAAVQAALTVTAIVALFSYPLVRGFGRAAHNPSSLPRNYAVNLATVIGVIWAVAAVAVLARLRTRRPPGVDSA